MRTRIIITQLTTAINSEPYKSPIKSRKSYGLEFLRSYLRPTIAWTQWYRRIVASARRTTTWKIETSRGILECSILWGSGNRVSRRLEKAFVTSPRLDKTGAKFPISRKFQFYRSSLARDFFLFRFGWEKREKQIDLIRVTTNIPPRYFLGLGDSRFNWLSRLSIIPRNKYTNIAVPNSSEIPSLGPLQTATLSRFSVLSSDGFPPF